MMKMKKSFLFLAAIGAITLTSCSNDDFVGQGPGTTSLARVREQHRQRRVKQ